MVIGDTSLDKLNILYFLNFICILCEYLIFIIIFVRNLAHKVDCELWGNLIHI